MRPTTVSAPPATSTVLRPGHPLRVLAFAVIALTSACSGATERSVEELVRDGDMYLDPETRHPFTGLAFATYHSQPGSVARRLDVRGNVYEGPFDGPARQPRVSSREQYENGVRNGPYEWYFENGQLFEEGTYVAGRLDGPYRAYWETGELYEEGTYRLGDFEGPRRWYLNGRLIEMVTYRAGLIEGMYERYTEQGDLDLKGMLIEGEPCGMWIEGTRSVSYPLCAERITD